MNFIEFGLPLTPGSILKTMAFGIDNNPLDTDSALLLYSPDNAEVLTKYKTINQIEVNADEAN